MPGSREFLQTPLVQLGTTSSLACPQKSVHGAGCYMQVQCCDGFQLCVFVWLMEDAVRPGAVLTCRSTLHNTRPHHDKVTTTSHDQVQQLPSVLGTRSSRICCVVIDWCRFYLQVCPPQLRHHFALQGFDRQAPPLRLSCCLLLLQALPRRPLIPLLQLCRCRRAQ